MIDTAELRAMPSSLNDACRKMELAADCIDLLRHRLQSAEGDVIRLKEFIEEFGRPKAEPRSAKCPVCDGVGAHQWNCTLTR